MRYKSAQCAVEGCTKVLAVPRSTKQNVWAMSKSRRTGAWTQVPTGELTYAPNNNPVYCYDHR